MKYIGFEFRGIWSPTLDRNQPICQPGRGPFDTVGECEQHMREKKIKNYVIAEFEPTNPIPNLNLTKIIQCSNSQNLL